MTKPTGNPRGRPRKHPNEPTREQLVHLSTVTIQALVENELDVFLRIPLKFKFPKGMPKGIKHERDEATITHKIKAKQLLEWLYEKKYCKTSWKDVDYMKRSWNRKLEKIDKKFDDFLDIPQDEEYNDVIENEEERYA